MTDQVTDIQNQDQSGNVESLGWRAALPDELKTNEFVKTFTKPGDFVKSALDIKAEADGLKSKLANAIFKPGDGSNEEEVKAFRTALGVPDTPDGYEFPEVEGVQHDEQMVSLFSNLFHKAGVGKEAAAVISEGWDNFVKEAQAAQLQKRTQETQEAETKLKSEWGNSYDANIELTRRSFQKFSGTDLSTFLDETGVGNHPVLIKAFYEIGKALGEDQSLQSGGTSQKYEERIIYDKSPPPPKKE